MKREEVEALLAACVPGSEAFVPAMDEMTRRKMRALCRAWLALDAGAPAIMDTRTLAERLGDFANLCEDSRPVGVWPGTKAVALLREAAIVASAAAEVMSVPELHDMGYIGSHSPAEHALGLLRHALVPVAGEGGR